MTLGRRFEGRTVVVTGAGGAIRAETARRFAGEGALLLLTDEEFKELAAKVQRRHQKEARRASQRPQNTGKITSYRQRRY